MKIRTGFVSNSSSSSFCIVGISVQDGELSDLFDVGEECYEFEDYYKFAYKCLKDLDEHYGIYDYADSMIVGKKITRMKGDQTLNDFKKEIFEQLKQAGYKGNLDSIGIFIDGGFEE